jgi:hypothetical protein
MYRKFITLFLLIGLLFFSCEQDDMSEGKQEFKEQLEVINSENYVQGEMRIKVTQAMAGSLEEVADSSGIVNKKQAEGVNQYFDDAGVIYMARTFPYAGKFEARTRSEGLHLWYDVYYLKNVSLKKAGLSLSQIDGIDQVELRPKAVRTGNVQFSFIDDIKKEQSAINTMPFNDSRLDKQWHYYNDGEFDALAIEGCDINVFPVWENYNVGSSDVIVAVVDGGIDYIHEDLADNIWINVAEFNGSQGVDDDGNGYTDDIRGFNFVQSSGKITPDDHGTHVAGTIGAVNNNDKGVAGVAGGDKTMGISGVRLMSCQIFSSDVEGSGSGARAIKYGADNGAVISQNSWGYPDAISTPASDKAAIDYFTKYAGIDENGVQVGPIKGGLVIFAAGNENKETGHPASYEKAMAVAALAQDYKRAYYSNYGTWVDISAPGGDYNKGALILSTIPGNQYGTMQGTSMACPHVSGVAALLISHVGGSGVTNEDIWNRIVGSAKNIDSYNNALTGKLGSGLINVFGSIAGYSTIAPGKITNLSGQALSNNITVNFTIPTDTDDKKPYGVHVYYSLNSFSTNLQGISKKTFMIDHLNAGDVMSATVSELNFSSSYYVRAVAYDYAGNQSPISDIVLVTTLTNNSPVINALDGNSSTIKAYQTSLLRFEVSDPDHHPITWSCTKSSSAIIAEELNGVVNISITGRNAPAGNYTDTLVVEDAYGATVRQVITYFIEPNVAPVVKNQIEDIVFGGIARKSEFSLTDYFYDADGEPLTYTVELSSRTVAHVNPSNDKLFITSVSYGFTTVSVKATDALGKSSSIDFKILVRDENVLVDVYPNPVVNLLNVRTGLEVNANISIVGGNGATVFNKNLDVSPFEPARIDMSKMGGGSYTVNVAYAGNEFKINIVKL